MRQASVALGNTTSFSYDLIGRRTSTLWADNSRQTNVFNILGQLVRSGDGTRWVTNCYNMQGLLTVSSNAFGQAAKLTYDLEDRPTNMVNAANVSVVQTFDNLDRVLTRTHPDGGVEKFGYSSRGLVAYTNQLSQVTLYAYDAVSRKTAETNANNEITQYSYSSAGNLLTLTDGKSQVTTWKYDSFGRVTNKLDNLNASMFVYRYDANNRMTNRWTPAKTNTYYGYDAVGNLITVDYAASPDITLSYDADNRLTNMIDAVGTTRFGYTAASLLQSEDGPWSDDTISYSYTDRMRSSLSLLQPNASAWSQTYAYDAGYRLTNITTADGAFGYQYQGNPSKLVQRLLLPNSAYITNAYDSMARLTNTTLNSSANSPLNVHRYTYNPGNQRTNTVRIDGSKVVSFCG